MTRSVLRPISTRAAPGRAPDWTEVMGINDRVELAAAGTVLQTRINTGWMQAGVSLIDPATTYIDATVRFEGEATVWPGCLIQGGSVIGKLL